MARSAKRCPVLDDRAADRTAGTDSFFDGAFGAVGSSKKFRRIQCAVRRIRRRSHEKFGADRVIALTTPRSLAVLCRVIAGQTEIPEYVHAQVSAEDATGGPLA